MASQKKILPGEGSSKAPGGGGVWVKLQRINTWTSGVGRTHPKAGRQERWLEEIARGKEGLGDQLRKAVFCCMGTGRLVPAGKKAG